MTEFTRLNELAQEDAALVLTLVDMFKEQSTESMNELKEYLTNQQGQEAKVSAHTFKGVCLNMGLDELAAHCKTIEDTALEGNFEDALFTYTQLLGVLQTTLPELDAFCSTLPATCDACGA